MDKVLAVILGGGQGTRLYPLTKFRAKPAVPLGGKYRLIDVPISNCINSDLEKIYVLTQFNSASLNRHISQTYRFDTFSHGFVEVLAAEQTLESPDWYQGTADAVRQQLRHMMYNEVDQFLILSGDHLYRMDYSRFVNAHREQQADVTIAVKPVSRQVASQFGILQVNKGDRIIDFVEKPESESVLDDLQIELSTGSGKEDVCLASMGIYIFDSGVLGEILRSNSGEDFGEDIIPHAIQTRDVLAYRFEGYWEDIGTIEAFYRANVALCDPEPSFEFYRPEGPVYTHPRYLAASRIDGAHMEHTLLGDGSDIRNAEIERSVVGIRSRIGSGSTISNTVIMGADFYETQQDLAHTRKAGIPRIGIGDNCEITGAIIDKNARIGDDVTIINRDNLEELERENYVIRDGIVVIPKNALIRDGTRI